MSRSSRWFFASVFAALAALVTSGAGPRLGTSVSAQAVVAAPADISPEALAQIDALIREKDARTDVDRKIDSELLYELRMESGEPVAAGVGAVETDLPYANDGHVVVDVKAAVTPALLSTLAGMGVEVESVTASALRAHIDIAQVQFLASLPDVQFVQPKQAATTTRWSTARPREAGVRRAALRARLADAIGPAITNVAAPTGQGSRSSEGDVTHLAFAARGAYHIDGTGVKIGVLSDGVTSLAASQAAGDLGQVTVLPGQVGSGDEGTAMLEIVHDLAPGAQLYFATAFTSIASFAQNIRDLRAAGCDIIVDDVFYFVETPFQDGQLTPSTRNGGIVIQAVKDVTASGALYFSSAGNSGNVDAGTGGAWEGDFADGGATGSPLPSPGAGRLHSFGTQAYDVLTTATTNPTVLYWTDPIGGSSNDYDLFRLNSAGTSVVASSTNVQSGTQDPYEQISGSAATAGQRIVIVKANAAAPRFLHLNTNRGRLSIATSGQTHGHSAVDSIGAYGIAATPAVGPYPNAFNSTNVVETFSSDGPRRIFFDAAGTAITPGNVSSTGGKVLQKPDVTAADGVSVTGVGGFGSPFFGTSAAAPHAAAIAALVKSADPSRTAAQVRTILTSTAIDIQAAGVDRDSGAGILMANAAVGATGVAGTAFLVVDSVQAVDNPGNGNGKPEAGEGARLTVTLKNYGVAPATGIAGTLTTTTTGITITQPTATTFADLGPGASGTNGSLETFTVASNFPCPASASFSLNLGYQGGPSPVALTFPVAIGPGDFTITRSLNGATPPASTGISTASGLQVGRLFRDGVASTCAAPKPAAPALANDGASGPFQRPFESYAFTTCQNNVAGCATVTLTATTSNLFSAAYTPSFNPADIRENYVADAGASSTSRSYAFPVVAGVQTFAVDVHDVTAANPPLAPSNTPYMLSVAGACFGNCAPPNQVPVAKAKSVTVSAGPSCTADASVDDGSYDPDGDPLTLTQSPAGPYALGTTSVLLTVADPKGATSQADGSVTVVDSTAPGITGFALDPAGPIWPPNHKMIDVTVKYGAADNCSAASCVLSITGNEAVNGAGDGNTGPDWQVVDAHHIRVRAERSGTGTGRIYTITLTCTDAAGNRSVKTATLLVPHNQ